MSNSVLPLLRCSLTCLVFVGALSLTGLASALNVWIAVTEDYTSATHPAEILVLDPTNTDWNGSSAVEHPWAPSSTNGFTSPNGGWGSPADVKIRDYGNSQYIAVADTDGFVGVIPYPSLTGKLWANDIGSAAAVHGIELMPDGNVAVAAVGTTSSGWVRIYAASQGTFDSTYFEYDFESCHEVLWDPANSMLWAVGGYSVLGFKYDGTPAAPHLTLSVTSPSMPGTWGHLSPPSMAIAIYSGSR